MPGTGIDFIKLLFDFGISYWLWLRVRYRIRGFIHYRYGTVSLTSSKQQYGTVSRFQTSKYYRYGTVTSRLQVAWWTWLARAVWQTLPLPERHVCHFSPKQQVVTAISLSHLSQHTRQTRRADHTSFIPISARTDVYKYSFFPCTLLDGTLCLLKSISSTRCLQASQLIWSTKPWHSSSKGWCPLLDICWRTEWRFNRKCTEIGVRYSNRIWDISLNSLLQVYRKLPYPIPVVLGIRYHTCSIFNNGYGTVPADTSFFLHLC